MIAAITLMIIVGNFIGVAHSFPVTDISGKWAGQLCNPRGDTIDVVIEFKVQGEKLNGTLYAIGQEFPLADGKVKGDTIFFKVEGDTPEYTGKVSGDVIQMKSTWRGGEYGPRSFSSTLKRVKD